MNIEVSTGSEDRITKEANWVSKIQWTDDDASTAATSAPPRTRRSTGTTAGTSTHIPLDGSEDSEDLYDDDYNIQEEYYATTSGR